MSLVAAKTKNHQENARFAFALAATSAPWLVTMVDTLCSFPFDNAGQGSMRVAPGSSLCGYLYISMSFLLPTAVC